MNGISRKIYLEPEAPTEEDNRSDQKRIEEELKVRGVDATMTWQAMKKLYPLCEKADWKITVSLAWDEKNWKVVDLEAGDRSGEHYGVAVDLGSTTVAVRLVDCNTGKILGEVSTFNGQIPYGTDILTRIFHCQEDPKTLEDAFDIVEKFVQNKMGTEDGEDPIGLACDTDLVGTTSSNYSVDSVFDKFGASPQRWVNQNGKIVYGSVTEETKNALSYLHELYERGVLDKNFALRAQNNLRDLVINGKCGAFFGLWWTPNNPLMDVYETDKEANWQPFYLQSTDWQNVYDTFQDNKYVVVRKGYEHPEIVMKIISVLFDYSRYEAKDADEVNDYFALNVEPTARPLVINVDYNEATFQITKDIQSVMSGMRKEKSLSAIEKSYYDAAEKFIQGKSETAEDWAAYESRLAAVGRLIEGNYRSTAKRYLDDADGEIPKSLQQLEKDTFI